MVHNNKILTVSYGTFSCTLEGFDDSFDTMKAIAEYFRDLASDDRYFGAEPPVPDADMLARIAQREISRKVEAHEEDGGGILLRAQDVPHAAAALTTGAVVAPEVTEPQPQPVVETSEIIEAADDSVEDADIAPDADSLDTAASFVEAPAPESPDPVVEAPVEAAVSEEPEAVEPMVSEPLEQMIAEEPESDIDAPSAVEVAQETADEKTAEVEIAEPVEETAVEPDSIAAKLQRIRAVVSRNEAEAQVVEFTEDEHADAYVAAVASEMTDALNEDDEAFLDGPEYDGDSEVLDALKRLDTAFELEADEVEDLADDLLPTAAASGIFDAFADAEDTDTTETKEIADNAAEALEDRFLEETADTVPTFEGSSEESEATEDVMSRMQTAFVDNDDVEAETLESISESLAGVQDESLFEDIEERAYDEADADLADNVLAPEDEAIGLDDLEAALSDETTADSDETGLEVDECEDGDFGADRQIEQAILEEELEGPQILKVNRSEFEAAISDGELDELAEVETAETAETAASSLSQEAEDELMRELAQVEAELNSVAEPDEMAALESGLISDLDELATDTDQELTEAGETALPEVSEFEEDYEEDMSRLMAAADEKMGGEETASTREAYNQMRGAVAVAEAERSVGGSIEDEAADDVYRDDLASVVRPRRPRRPAPAGINPDRPAVESRPAPLKLVAEQRIDADAGLGQRGPVRPRRVASAQADDAAGQAEADNSFVEFASEMGAAELPELLEAAASYLSFVEGRAQFSRPQLMNKVRLIDSSNFNREDGLRSFGRLLREGKIEKTGGGRFTASGDIGYRPDERAVG